MTQSNKLACDAHQRDMEIMADGTIGLVKGFSPAELVRICRPCDFPEDDSLLRRPRISRQSMVWRQNHVRWELGQRRIHQREALARQHAAVERERRAAEADGDTVRGMYYFIHARSHSPASALRRLFPRDFDRRSPIL